MPNMLTLSNFPCKLLEAFDFYLNVSAHMKAFMFSIQQCDNDARARTAWIYLKISRIQRLQPNLL